MCLLSFEIRASKPRAVPLDQSAFDFQLDIDFDIMIFLLNEDNIH